MAITSDTSGIELKPANSFHSNKSFKRVESAGVALLPGVRRALRSAFLLCLVSLAFFPIQAGVDSQNPSHSSNQSDSLAVSPGKAAGGEIIDFGVFEPIGDEVITSADTSKGSVSRVADRIKFIRRTDQIEARVGLRFGLRFFIWGLKDLPGADRGKTPEVELTRVIQHPSIKGPDGQLITTRTRSYRYRPVSGTILDFSGFIFEKEYERVAGEWVFQIYQGKKLLVEQRFIVRKTSENVSD